MTTEKIEIATSTGFNKEMIGSQCMEAVALQINAIKTLKLCINFEADAKTVSVEMIRQGEPTKKKVLYPGDILDFKHDFTVDITRVVKQDHPFPINIEYKGEKYLLSKTKNDKLLLTK